MNPSVRGTKVDHNPIDHNQHHNRSKEQSLYNRRLITCGMTIPNHHVNRHDKEWNTQHQSGSAADTITSNFYIGTRFKCQCVSDQEIYDIANEGTLRCGTAKSTRNIPQNVNQKGPNAQFHNVLTVSYDQNTMRIHDL